MSEILDIARVGALMGDPSRAAMLMALMSGEALTAGELAFRAGVALPTASAHLAQLAGGALLTVAKQGRHPYYRLAGPAVAHAVETLSDLAIQVLPSLRRVMPEDAPLRRARTCYDHLAGRLGVAVADGLVRRGVLRRVDGAPAASRGGAWRRHRRPLSRYRLDPPPPRRPRGRCDANWPAPPRRRAGRQRLGLTPRPPGSLPGGRSARDRCLGSSSRA